MTQPIQTKKIKILSLDSREFNGVNGPWTKYNIKADDNQFYGTTDATWFNNRKIGETLIISFWQTVPAANKFGKMVSYNNIVSDEVAKTSAPTNNLSDAIIGLANLIKKSEANIIDAIRLHCGSEIEGIEITPKTLQEQLDEPEIPIVEDDGSNPF